MVRGFYSTEEVLGWVRAAPDGGWGGAEICSVFPYILTACRRIFLFAARCSGRCCFQYSNTRAKRG